MLLLIALAVAFIYLALLYAAPGPDKSGAAAWSAPLQPKVLRNLVLSVVIFFSLDGVIFHTRLYQSLLEPKSNAGRVLALARQEKQRRPAGGKEILVLGDSRMGIGFSEEVANEIAAGRDVSFFNRSMPESVPRLWYYLLREIDPSASRYQAIVMPLKVDIDPSPLHTTLVHISQAAPLLRYTDAFAFAASFDSWSDQSRAFVACLLRGSAFQADLLDFLEHPLQRISHLKQPRRDLPRHAFHKRADQDVVGIDYDPLTHELKIPERLSKRQRNSIQNSIQNTEELARSANCSSNCYDWTKRILQRYDSSVTSVVLVHLPKGPLAAKLENRGAAQNNATEALRGHKVIVFDPAQFAFLEQPAYYMDGSHLNGKGQEQFTRRLTEDLLAQFDSRNAAQAQAAGGPPLRER
ncbi:MAG: hypothetical protein DME34_00355 [Verrucomicrobia bacterium]|nr:MAG: hypothetical protein DME34_00355 [Verrucomicrobiota bacterium]